MATSNDRKKRRTLLMDELARMGLTEERAEDETAPPDSEQTRAAPDDPVSRNGEPADVGAPPPVEQPQPQRLTSESLTAETVLKPQAKRPASGWRRVVYDLTGGEINPGPSEKQLREQELTSRARTPIKGCYRVAVISLKGGVGKTTTTAVLGATFASLRGDRVIAVDANPDRGTLAEKVARETWATVRDLLAAHHKMDRYSNVRQFTSQAPSRLEVLASDSDPSVSLAFSEDEYRQVIDVLERHYNLILTDCGTGLLHSALQGALALADSIIIVSSPSLDGARSASATLDWLEAHGYGELARRGVTVISTVRAATDVDLDRVEEHFAARCRGVQRIPYDPHLATGAAVDLGELKPATRDAYLQLAALVGEGFVAGRPARA